MKTPAWVRSTKIQSAVHVIAGILNVFVGFVLAIVGLGFANSSACGTGAAIFFAGLWMIFSFRGAAKDRLLTNLGLALASAWIAARIILDFPAVGSGIVLFLFFLPAISLPLGLVWVVFSLLSFAIRAIKVARLIHATGFAWQKRPAMVTASLLACLVALTFVAPRWGSNLRAKQIATLSSTYKAAPNKRAQPATFGVCSMAFLGYSLTQKGAGRSENPLRDGQAEIASAKAAGAAFFRVGASGDHLLNDNPHQEEVDDRYVAAVRKTGMQLVLVDTQHPDVCKRRKLTWPEFCKFQCDRIRYYQERYSPEVYIVVCEPLSYHGFALQPGTTYSPSNWIAQLSEMCRMVKSIRKETKTGICLLVGGDREPEWQVWEGMKTLPELDLLSVEIYQPEDFSGTQARLKKYGHPARFNKEFWIAETYNGWALNGARDWDLDAAWIRLTADYARAVDAEAVLVWSFGTFVPGGSFWDFGDGGLARKWADGTRLSVVGEAFRSVAGH